MEPHRALWRSRKPTRSTRPQAASTECGDRLAVGNSGAAAARAVHVIVPPLLFRSSDHLPVDLEGTGRSSLFTRLPGGGDLLARISREVCAPVREGCRAPCEDPAVVARAPRFSRALQRRYVPGPAFSAGRVCRFTLVRPCLFVLIGKPLTCGYGLRPAEPGGVRPAARRGRGSAQAAETAGRPRIGDRRGRHSGYDFECIR